MISKHIFNADKTDYGNSGSVFLGQPRGLLDTVHKNHPEIWKLYKQSKADDWDELEFDFKPMNVEFKTRSRSIVDRMMKTIAWQWEADSVAANSILTVLGPLITSSEAYASWSAITTVECLHSSCYSEIVKNGFDDSESAMSSIIAEKKALERLSTISEVMSNTYKVAHEYALGLRMNNQETYNAAYLFVIALLILERIQFMASFAITFAIGETNAFMQIVEAVKKICHDEYEIHVEMDKAVLRNEHKNERGQLARQQTLPLVRKMIRDAVDLEYSWIDYMNMDLDPLSGLNGKNLKQWVSHSAGDVYDFLEILPDSDLVIPKKNPLKYMENYMDMSRSQGSPQEMLQSNYKLKVMTRNDANKLYDIDW